MQVIRRSRTSLWAVLFASSFVAACGADEPTRPTSELAGTYAATTFRVTPDGGSPIDVLAGGGSLTVTLHANSSVDGALFLPGSLTGEGDLNATMTGTVNRGSGTVEFQQGADTFVRDLTWTIGSNALSVVNQRAGGATFTITLTRQSTNLR